MAEAQRRLTTIVAADIAGFSRLVGTDEEGVLAAQQRHRRELFDPLLDEFHGRVANTAGDSLLLEFPSAVEAVRFAVAVQQGMASRNSEVSSDRRIEYRIGINVGDVLAQGGDLLGDGVNVAARLEGLAEPGGICISRTARDQVRDRMDIELEDMGEVEVKNIARPVRVFRVLQDGKVSSKKAVRSRPPWVTYAAVAAFVFVVAVAGGVWWWQIPDFEPADPSSFAYRLPERPSIAVLPLDYTGTDEKENGYLADGLSQNIVSSLGHRNEILVIDWGSTHALKGKEFDFRSAAERFGVQYILKGSVQKPGEKLRIAVRLADATNGRVLWSRVFDRELQDFFEIQDGITKDILVAMNVKLVSGNQGELAAAATTTSLKAYSLASRAWQEGRKYTPQSTKKALELLRLAEEEDPEYAAAMTSRALMHLTAGRSFFSKDPKASLAKAMEIADKAVRSKPDYAFGLATQGFLDLWRSEHSRAIKRTERAVEIFPNSAGSNMTLGHAYLYNGYPENALAWYERAKRLDTRFLPSLSWHQFIALTDAEKYQDALRQIEQHVKKRRVSPYTYAYQAISLAALGRDDEAKAAITTLLEKYPGRTSRSLFHPIMQPYKDDWAFKRYAPILSRLGLPEHPPEDKRSKPSIAVLPFANPSADEEQGYFADGITEDLITDLSKVSGLIVIARNSVFTYKGKNVKIQDVARDLNVSHVLEGSVRKSGNRLRITAQLIDGETGAHLWAEKFDRKPADVFALQDEIVEKISRALKVALLPEEKRVIELRPTKSLEAYEAFLQARHFTRLPRAVNKKKAIDHVDRALALDPEFVAAQVQHALTAFHIWRHTASWAIPILEAKARLDHAISRVDALDPGNPRILQLKTERAYTLGQPNQALALIERALKTNPNNARLLTSKSDVLLRLDRLDEAREVLDAAVKVWYQLDAQLLSHLAANYSLLGDFETSVRLAKQARQRGYSRYPTAWILASSFVGLNQMDAAREEANFILEAWPSASTSRPSVTSTFPAHSKIGRQWFARLRAAGLPRWPYGGISDDKNRIRGKELMKLFFGGMPYLLKFKSKRGEQELIGDGKGTWTTTVGRHRNDLGVQSTISIDNDLVCARSAALFFGKPYCSEIHKNAEENGKEANPFLRLSPIGTMTFSRTEISAAVYEDLLRKAKAQAPDSNWPRKTDD